MNCSTFWNWTVLAFAVVAIGFSESAASDDLQTRIESAEELKVEDVCTPIRGSRGGRGILVPNRDGKTYDYLIRYYDTYWGPHTTFIIDLGTGKVRQHVVPESLYSGTTLGPDGILYGHRYEHTGTILWTYDPAKNEIKDVPGTVPVGGETKPIVIGTDGKIYGGGSRSATACAYRYDPDTGKTTDFGKMGPSHAPNKCWGYSLGADDRYVYIASGKIPWYLVAHDRQTGKDEVLLTANNPRDYIGVSQLRYGCRAVLKPEGKPSVNYWLHRGKAKELKEPREKPPWPEPEKVEPWIAQPAKPEVWLGKAIPKSDGKAEVWYRAAEVNPANSEWNIVKLDVPTYPVPILRLVALDDGRLCGSGQSYMGNFIYDPKTGRHEHLGRLPLSHYCTTVLDGIVYMSGYPSSALHVFDPKRPWTVEVSSKPGVDPLAPDHKDSNPRRVAYLAHHGAGCHKMWSAARGSDGKAYFGGRWYRNGIGGGLGWWDPRQTDPEQAAGGISEPFRNYQVTNITAVGRYIAVSTKAVRDEASGTAAPKEAKLLVFDTKTGKIVRDLVPVPGANATGHIAGVGGDALLGLTYDPADRQREPEREEIVEYIRGKEKAYGLLDRNSILYKVNVATGKVLWTKKIPYPVGFRTNENFANQDGFDFRLGPDGKVWTFTGARFEPVNPEKKWHYSYINCVLVRIDPKDGTLDPVGKLDRGGEMAFVGTDLYLTGGCKYLTEKNMYLRRIRSIVSEK